MSYKAVSVAIVTLMVSIILGATSYAQGNRTLPGTGYVTSYGGVTLRGQCVPVARELGEKLVGPTLPYTGGNGVAADLWTLPSSGFNRIDRVKDGQVKMPPVYSFIIWSRQLGGTGHVAMVIGSVDGRRKIVRVVDANWGNDERGQIHDVNLNDSRILGYLTRR